MEDKPTLKQPLLNNTLLLFMFAMVLANIGGNMYGPLLPLYLVTLKAGVVQVGLFFTLARIFPLVLQVIGGWLSDSLGRLRSIALGSLAGVLSYFGLILAPTWQWVLLGEGLGSVTRSLIGPSYPAFIAEQSSEGDRARVFAITQAIFSAVAVIGPPLGGWLADRHGFKIMLICAGTFYTLAAVIRVGMARVAARGSEAQPRGLSLGGLRGNLVAIAGMVLAGGLLTWIFVTDGVGDISWSLSFDLLPVYLKQISGMTVQQVGWLTSIFGAASMLANLPGGWLADRKGERVAIALGFLLNAVAIIIFLRVTGFWSYAASWALYGIGTGMTAPAYQSLTSKVVPERLRGTAFGLLHGSLGVFSLPAPAIGGQLWEHVGPRFPFQLTAGAVLVSVIPVWLKFKLPAKAPEIQEVTPGT